MGTAVSGEGTFAVTEVSSVAAAVGNGATGTGVVLGVSVGDRTGTGSAPPGPSATSGGSRLFRTIKRRRMAFQQPVFFPRFRPLFGHCDDEEIDNVKVYFSPDPWIVDRRRSRQPT